LSDASGPRPVPVTDDPDTAGFFEAARRGQLALRFCPRCNLVVHFPRAYCDRCPGSATEWRTVRPAATLYSFTRCEHQVHRAFPVPYTLVLVELDDHPGARLVGHLPGTPELVIGAPMRVSFEELPDGSVLPQWSPVPATG
jgi:uncharacterized OB-fold protein